MTVLVAGSGGWIFGSDRLPFADLHWPGGRPHVPVEGRLLELRSVDGVSVRRLLDRAASRWGPAYQDAFAPALGELLSAEGRRLGLTCELELVSPDDGRPVQKRVVNTRWKRRRYSAALARRRTVSRDRVSRGPPDILQARTLRRLDGTSPRPGRPWLDREEALADLAGLEWYLSHRYSYLESSDVDHRATLDRIAAELGPGISRRDFALRLAVLLAGFGDGHTRVLFGASGVRLPPAELPCILVPVGRQVACVRRDRKGFLDRRRPLLLGVDGVPIDRIAGLVGALVPRASEDFHRVRSLRHARRAELVDGLLGRKHRGACEIELAAPEETLRLRRRVETVIPSSPPEGPAVDWHVLPSRVGYLGLRFGLFPTEGFRREMVNALQAFRHTRGLILDLRGNPGGSRHALRTLLPFLVRPTEIPEVLNVAAVRMDADRRPGADFALLEPRGLFPLRSDRWTSAQRRYLSEFQAGFRPRIDLPVERFSSLHFMVLEAAEIPGAYHYDQPVVVLQDERTASAAGLLVAALKGRPSVTVLGFQNGGGSGYPLRYRLPASEIVFQLSAMASFRPDGRLYTGTEPDLVHRRTLAELERELYEGADPLLERAVGVILERTGANR